MKYCSLHQHSDGSFLDSCNQPKRLAKKAKDVGMPAIALTDHGNVHNYVKMYKECKKQGIKFIPGLEFYFTHKHADRERKSRHITILAMNDDGLKTIYELSTLSNYPVDEKGGFFYRPRIDWEMLESHNKGLIVLTGCMNSPINHEFAKGDYDTGKKHAEHLLSIFGKDRMFVELQMVNDPKDKPNRNIYIPEQDIIFDLSRKLATDLDLLTVATNDSHYLDKNDAFAHEVLKAIDARKTLADPPAGKEEGERGRLVFSGFDYHVKSTDEMLEKFTPKEVEQSSKIADMCNVQLPLKQNHIPKFDVNIDDKQAMELLRKEMRKGWKELNLSSKPNKDEYVKRVETELKDVEEAGLQNYFLIVWDVVRYCLDNKIPVGRGRGSAAGSLVSYLLRITDVDPIENGLIWERFWNRGRKGSMPDVDLDICVKRRNEVVDYLRKKFGEDKVFPMCAISTMTAKAAIKDVGKVVGLPFSYVNQLTDLIPHKCNSIQQAIDEVDEIKKMATEGIDKEVECWEKEISTLKPIDPNAKIRIDFLNNQIADRKKKLKTTFDVAQKLEDVARQRSAHACALLISDEPVFGKVPLCFDAKKRKMLTAFDMYDLEDLGYLKLDILGLKTLDVCSKVYPDGVRSLQKFDDPKVFELISSGNTKGVFQLESPLGRQWCKKIKPKTIGELSDLNALLRPAVLEIGMADEYVKNRSDPVEAEAAYIHPNLKPILKDTYGCVVYQEQMLEIAKVFAGFSLSEADILRKAVGKKIPEEIAKLKDGFIQGVVKHYSDQKLGEELWSWIEKGAEYGFNKSHSLSYAQLAYITAWMKLYHTEKFFWALLMHSEDEQKPQEEIRSIFFDAKRFGVHVRPPSSIRGNIDFELDGKNIYFGLRHIKGIGETSCKTLQAVKTLSWQEVLRGKKVKIKKTIMEGLILSGAFDDFSLTRRDMLLQYQFMNELTDKEVPIFEHILYGDPVNLVKSTKDAIHNISITRGLDFNDAVSNLKTFIEVDNAKYKLINSNRAERLKEVCKKFIDEYNGGKEFSIREVANFETEYLGIPATCSSVDAYYSHKTTHFLIEVDTEQSGAGICTVGMISNFRQVIDKNGREMAFITLEDKSFSLDGVIFAKAYSKHKNIIEKDKVVLLEGKKKGGSFIIDQIEIM